MHNLGIGISEIKRHSMLHDQFPYHLPSFSSMSYAKEVELYPYHLPENQSFLMSEWDTKKDTIKNALYCTAVCQKAPFESKWCQTAIKPIELTIVKLQASVSQSIENSAIP